MIELATGVVSHAVRRRGIQAGTAELGEPCGVPVNDPGHACLAAVIRAVLGGPVKVGDCRGQWCHELAAEGAGRCQSIEQCLLREAIHFHQPIDRAAVSPERIRPVISASDGGDSTIERRCRPPIEAHFNLTQTATSLGR